MWLRRFLYNNFRFVSTVKHSLKRSFTPRGHFVLALLFITAAVGVDTNVTTAYQVFMLLLAMLVSARLWSLFFRPRIDIRRVTPRFGTAGQPLRYRVVVDNGSGRTQRGLELIENLADPRPSFAELVAAREPEEATRNRFDRTVGYHRWLWLIARRTVATASPVEIPDLPPRGRGEVTVELQPQRRGQLTLTSASLARLDPLGLYRALATVPRPDTIAILPRRYALPAFELPGGRRHQPGGETAAHAVGNSEEFLSLRDYRPGDPLRWVHWRSWAKTGRPIVKEYRDEFFVRHALVLDTFTDAPYSDAFEEAVSVAASFVSSIQTQESLLDLMFVGDETYCFTSGRGVAHTEQMLEILAAVQACRNRSFAALPPAVLERASLVSACVCVLLAWDEARQDLVARLQGLGVPVLVLVVLPREAGDDIDPGPMRRAPGDFVVLHPGEIEQGLAQCAASATGARQA